MQLLPSSRKSWLHHHQAADTIELQQSGFHAGEKMRSLLTMNLGRMRSRALVRRHATGSDLQLLPCARVTSRSKRTSSTWRRAAVPRSRWLLRTRRKWPRGCRAAQQGHELAAFHCQRLTCFEERNSTEATAALQDFEPVSVADGFNNRWACHLGDRKARDAGAVAVQACYRPKACGKQSGTPIITICTTRGGMTP
jgi:hypothetical protein